MKEFFEWTAWAMEKPTSYGAFHIIFTLILLGLAILGAYLLRNTNDKQNRIVLATVGIVLLIFELYKILFHIYEESYGWGFWGVFPFQLCSVPMYLCIFCALCKNKKINSWLYEFMFCVNMFGGIMAFLEPSGIHHPIITLTVHAYLWHMTLIFIGLYLYLSKRVCNDRRSYINGIIVYYIACVIAQSFNLIYGDKINCFYISPYVQSPLAVFKDIYASCGWFVNMFLLMLGITIASAVIYYTGYFIRAKRSAKEKISV